MSRKLLALALSFALLFNTGITYAESIDFSSPQMDLLQEEDTPVSPLSSVNINSITADKSGTLGAGTKVTWTNNATGQNLKYYWRVYKDGALVYQDKAYINTNNPFSYTLSEPGVYQARGYVLGDGITKPVLKNSAKITVNGEVVSGPTSTEIISIVPDKTGTVEVGTQITWTNNSTGKDLKFYWRVYKDGVLEYQDKAYESGKTTFTYTADKPGVYQARGYVTAAGISSPLFKNSSKITVKESSVTTATPASIVSVTADKTGTVSTGTPITWTTNATGNDVVYAWKLYKDGSVIVNDTVYSSAKKSFTFTPNSPGRYTATAFIKASGLTTFLYKHADTVRVETGTGTVTAPKINSVTADKAGPVAPSTKITWTCDATGNNLTYQWIVYKNGTQIYADYSYSSYSKTFNYTPTEVGTYSVRANVKGNGITTPIYKNSANIVVEKVVVNTPVTIKAVTADKTGPVAPSTKITWTCDATGNNLTYQWIVYKNGTQIYADNSYSSYSKTFNYTPTEVGTYSVRANVKGDGITTPINKNSANIVVEKVVITDPTTGRIDKTGPVYTGQYLVVSNEATTFNSTETTGKLPSISNLEKDITANQLSTLETEAFRMNPIMPFDKTNAKPIEKRPANIEIKPAVVGSTAKFNTENMVYERNEVITAKLLYSGTSCEVWVENENEINSTKATSIGREFDQKINSFMATNFGKPSDINGDGKVTLLVYDIRDDFEQSGGYIGGYFWGRDLYNTTNSNNRELLYIDTYPLMGQSKTNLDVTKAYSTIVHEYQHLINFSVRTQANLADMDTWMNEGLSMAAEHMYQNSVLSSRINYFNNSPAVANGHSVLKWGTSQDETLANYSMSYLFMQYLRVQANQGGRVFNDILASSKGDYRAVEDVIKKYINPNMTFGEFMTNFRVAMIAKEATGMYGFKNEPGFSAIRVPLYTGTMKSLMGGGSIYKKIPSTYTDQRTNSSTVKYVGIQ